MQILSLIYNPNYYLIKFTHYTIRVDFGLSVIDVINHTDRYQGSAINWQLYLALNENHGSFIARYQRLLSDLSLRGKSISIMHSHLNNPKLFAIRSECELIEIDLQMNCARNITDLPIVRKHYNLTQNALPHHHIFREQFKQLASIFTRPLN